MKELFKTNTKKFWYWHLVEITVLAALVDMKRISREAFREISERTWVDDVVAHAIERRDKKIKHDLNAFIEIMRLQILLPRETCLSIFMLEGADAFNNAVKEGLRATEHAELASLFHNGMTSYDTEEPAMALLLIDACRVVNENLERLADELRIRTKQHRGCPMMGRTHGQHAQPITFGIKLLNYEEQVRHAGNVLTRVEDELRVMKLSGAVGTYGTIPPEVETSVGKLLNLTPLLATQIIPLDRRARVVNELAIVASVLEKITRDLWQMSTTEVGEVREPFSKEAKGSSAMPHKKNPITLEKVFGLASIVRGCASAVMENVATSHERDISHSSVERLALVDAFATVDHMLECLTTVISGMEVFPERMKRNMELSYGTFASQKVEMFLKSCGMPAEEAYRTVQESSFYAMSTETPLRKVLVERCDPLMGYLIDPVRMKQFDDCFNWSLWVSHEPFLFERQSII